MKVKKDELLSLVSDADKIYVTSNITLFPAYIEVNTEKILEFIEHNFSDNTRIKINIRENNLYILPLKSSKISNKN